MLGASAASELRDSSLGRREKNPTTGDAWRDGWMKVEDMHDVRSQMSVNIRRQPRACSDINHNGPLDWISNDI
jgi:hypothetical protein